MGANSLITHIFIYGLSSIGTIEMFWFDTRSLFWPPWSRCLCVSAQTPHRYPHSPTHRVVSWVGHNYTASGCSLIKFDRPLQLCTLPLSQALCLLHCSPALKHFRKCVFGICRHCRSESNAVSTQLSAPCLPVAAKETELLYFSACVWKLLLVF